MVAKVPLQRERLPLRDLKRIAVLEKLELFI